MKKTNLMLAITISSLLAVSANAANDAAIIKKAKDLQNAKKFDEAVKLYEANTKTTASENLYLDYATLLINLKKFKECEDMLNKAVAAYPNNLRLKNALGQVKYKNGNLSGASTLFSQVLIKDSNNKYAKEMLDKIRKDKVAASSPLANIGKDKGSGNKSENADENLETEDLEDEDFSGGLTFKLSDKLSLEEQQELSKKLFLEMVELDKHEINSFISLYKQVIEKCHLTPKAEISCWRLSNLYILGTDPAEYNNCVACLEHLIKHYPNSEYVPAAKNRLLTVYEKTKNFNKLCSLYEEAFKNDPNPGPAEFMRRSVSYGKALKGAARYEEAQEWFTKVLELDKGKNSISARVARKELENLGN